MLPWRPAEGLARSGNASNLVSGQKWVEEVGIYILLFYSNQKLNQVLRLLTMVPTAGLVHPYLQAGHSGSSGAAPAQITQHWDIVLFL